MPTQRPKTQFRSLRDAKLFAREQGLMEWKDVADHWRRLSGETISDKRVWQIGMEAQRKLRDGLADLDNEYTAARPNLTNLPGKGNQNRENPT